MLLRCINFGPIKDGTIDLNKDLTILCGYNSSGKSYISYLLYGILSGNISFNINAPFVNIYDFTISNYNGNSDILIAHFKVDLSNVRNNHLNLVEISIANYIKNKTVDIFPDTKNFESSEFKVSLPNDNLAVIRELIYAANSTISSPANDSIDGPRASISFFKHTKTSIIEFRAIHGNLLKDKELTKEIISLVHSAVIKIIFAASINNSLYEPYFFPAERIALDVFNWDIIEGRKGLRDDAKNEIVFERISFNQNIPLDSRRKMRISKKDNDRFYPLPIRDYIFRAIQYRTAVYDKGHFYNIGEELEVAIGNSLSLDDKKRLDLTLPSGNALPMKYASSTIKSLSSFIFFLKHQAQVKDTVFFDEPELSLHPTIQRKLAVILAKLVRMGVRIVISTHSDFLLREFNNLIMLYQKSEQAKELLLKYQDIGYNDEVTLNPERVGVNTFGKGTIEASNVTEQGFDVSSIDDVIIKQNNIAEDIYFSLF